MTELRELENHAAEFSKRDTRLIVASLEEPEVAGETQAEFPHLSVVADANQSLSKAFEVIHEGVYTPDQRPANAPTTILIDGEGRIRWVFRPTRHIERLKPSELLAAIDEQLGKSR